MSLAIMFPGQGSQSVGMGNKLADEFPEARQVFQEVDDALGQKLFKIISEGPEDPYSNRECSACAHGRELGANSSNGEPFRYRPGFKFLICSWALVGRVLCPGSCSRTVFN